MPADAHHHGLGQAPNWKAASFACACVAVAIPSAWAVAALGHGLTVQEPRQDIAVLLLWSVAEEIVFRGALQPAIARALPRAGSAWITPANALTSLLFALLHLWRHPPIVAALVYLVSLVYGRMRELSGRVWPAALLHFVFNMLLYGASWLQATLP